MLIILCTVVQTVQKMLVLKRVTCGEEHSFYHNNNDDKDDKNYCNGYGANLVLKCCFLVKLLIKKDKN